MISYRSKLAAIADAAVERISTVVVPRRLALLHLHENIVVSVRGCAVRVIGESDAVIQLVRIQVRRRGISSIVFCASIGREIRRQAWHVSVVADKKTEDVLVKVLTDINRNAYLVAGSSFCFWSQNALKAKYWSVSDSRKVKMGVMLVQLFTPSCLRLLKKLLTFGNLASLCVKVRYRS